MSVDELRAVLSHEDPRETARLVSAAAKFGFIDAQLILGQMFIDGIGVVRDTAAAYDWFRTAAHAGSPAGKNMVGRCHELGWGVAADAAIAATWYAQSAQAGLDWAQYNLANLYLMGNGVTRDIHQAMEWYRCAAAQGHAKSMNMIGRFFEEGWECSPDISLAFSWYRRAAEAGDFRAQYNLAGMLNQMGRSNEAHFWLERALAAGSSDFIAQIGDSERMYSFRNDLQSPSRNLTPAVGAQRH